MKLSPRLHTHLRLKNALINLVLLCALAGLAWLSVRYPFQADITESSSNTLTDATQQVLKAMPDNIDIVVYLKPGAPLRAQMEELIDRYIQLKPNLSLKFVNPDTVPEKARELGIGKDGLVTVEYQGRLEKLHYVDEYALTNALMQVTEAENRFVTFLSGHGERSPNGVANFDLGQFGKELGRRKINAHNLDLTAMNAVPNNSQLLVLSAPAVPLLEGEISIIKNYIDQGGSLLLLLDPKNDSLNPIADYIGIRMLPGTLVEPATQAYGINDPSFVLSNTYIKHPITQGQKMITVYPIVAGLEFDKESDFEGKALLKSSKQSWTESGAVSGEIKFDADSTEKQGPLPFAYALTRTKADKSEQRIVVVGDGDFLSNSYLDNVGNLDMGLKMVSWLVHDDRMIDVPARIAKDKSLQLTKAEVMVISFGFMVILPLWLFGMGIYVWRKRKLR